MSAGSWDNTGKRFIYPGIAKGKPILTIIEADNGHKDKEIPINEVDEILNSSWRPTASRSRSRASSGFNDLFVYDLAASKLTRLTTDPYRSWIRRGRPTARRSPSAPIGSRQSSTRSSPALCAWR